MLTPYIGVLTPSSAQNVFFVNSPPSISISKDVVVSGQYAYVASEVMGVGVVDLTANPANAEVTAALAGGLSLCSCLYDSS